MDRYRTTLCKSIRGLTVPVEFVVCATSYVQPLLIKDSQLPPSRTHDNRLQLGAGRLCRRFEATEVLREVLEVFRLGLPEAVEGEGRRAAQSVPLVYIVLVTL